VTTVAVLKPATRTLNALERAGWSVVAADRFGLCPGEGALLRELTLSAGRFVSVDYLAGLFYGADARRMPARLRLSVRVSRIRNALSDLGFPRDAIENDAEAGYALAPHYARQLRAMVEGA
jgi:DNA-binding response OmpR family regulator